MVKLASEEHTSQLLKGSGLLSRFIKNRSEHMTEPVGKGFDAIGVTDDNIRKAANWVIDTANTIHQKMQQAPEQIKQGYTAWMEGIEQGIKTQSKILDPQWSQHKEKKKTVLDEIKKTNNQKTSAESKPAEKKEQVSTEEKKFFEDLFAQASQTLADNTKQYVKLNEQLQTASQQQYIEQAELQKYVQELYAFATARDTISDVFDGFAVIAHLTGDRHMAGKIQTFGSAATSIMNHLHTITTGHQVIAPIFGTATSFSSIHPYVGIAMAVTSLIGLFNDDDDDAGNAMMEAMAYYANMLSRQIHQLHLRFDYLERQLDAQHRATMYAFFKMYQSQDDIYKYLARMKRELFADNDLVKGNLEHQTYMSAAHHQDTMSQFGALRIEAIDDLIIAIQKEMAIGLSPDMLSFFITQLYTKVVNTAKSSALTGSDIAPSNYKKIQEVLAFEGGSIYKHPAFGYINVIKKYQEQQCTEIEPALDVVNPLVYMRCVQTLTELLNHALTNNIGFSTDAKKTRALKEIQEIVELGVEAMIVIERTHNEPCMQKLFKETKEGLQAVSNLIAMYKQTLFDDILKQDMIDRVQKVATNDIALLDSMPPVHFAQLKKQLEFMNHWVNVRGRWDTHPYPIYFVDRIKKIKAMAKSKMKCNTFLL